MKQETCFREGRLDNKVAIITGGANGIGNAVVRQYLKEGAKVIFTDNVPDQAEAVGEELRAQGYDVTAVVADQANASDWEKVVSLAKEKYGALHILVNNAGINTKCAMPNVDMEVWQRMLDVNVTGPMIGMQTCAPLIRDSGGGAFVNVSSLGGVLGGPSTAYNVTKWGMCGLSRSAAFTYSAWNIRSNCICPGFVDGTNLTKAILQTDQKVIGGTIGDYALVGPGRYGTPDELAKVAVFLGSDDASYVNGLEVPVDGGLYSAGIYATMLQTSMEVFGGEKKEE